MRGGRSLSKGNPLDFINGVANDLVASVLLVVLGFIARGVFDRLRRRRALDHVHKLLGKSSRPLILVVFPLSTLNPPSSPKNVLWMSLPEGAAIARVGQVCRDAKPRTEMQLIHPSEMRDKDRPFVLVGGPDANPWSRRWIASAFPGLAFEPEQHRVRNGPTSWYSQIEDGAVHTDVGFLALGRTDHNNAIVMMWGSSELGTNIAARAFGELRSILPKADMRLVLSGKSVLIVVQANIDGYGVRTSDVSNIELLRVLKGNSPTPRQMAAESK